MGAILKFFLIVFVIYFLISRIGGFLLRNVLWFFGAQVIKKETQRHRNANYENNINSKQKSKNVREGEIDVTYIPDHKKQKGIDFTDGEYVDYEEIK